MRATTKKRNRQDATLINITALKKRVTSLEQQLARLQRRHATLARKVDGVTLRVR